jgi:hypothetical protein
MQASQKGLISLIATLSLGLNAFECFFLLQVLIAVPSFGLFLDVMHVRGVDGGCGFGRTEAHA